MKLERSFEEMENIFRSAICIALNEPDDSQMVRFSYQEEGAPSFSIDEDVVYIRLSEIEDSFSAQRNSIFDEIKGQLIKISERTRVWEVHLVAYGPNASKRLNHIKDRVFEFDVKKFTGPLDVYLIPTLPLVQRVPELYNGKWWNRFDMKLRYNELYISEEVVSTIEKVPIEYKKDINIEIKGG